MERMDLNTGECSVFTHTGLVRRCVQSRSRTRFNQSRTRLLMPKFCYAFCTSLAKFFMVFVLINVSSPIACWEEVQRSLCGFP